MGIDTIETQKMKISLPRAAFIVLVATFVAVSARGYLARWGLTVDERVYAIVMCAAYWTIMSHVAKHLMRFLIKGDVEARVRFARESELQTPGNEVATVLLRRCRQHFDSGRLYRFLIDGKEVGVVGVGEEPLNVLLSPGPHRAMVMLDWTSSNALTIMAKPGQHIIAECGSNLVGWKTLLAFWYVIRPNAYLWLRQVSSE
jgi:hypothetical protein